MRIAFLGLAVLLLGCTDPKAVSSAAPDPTSAAPAPCKEWSRRAVTAADVMFGCTTHDSGRRRTVLTRATPCDDGRTIFENELGWGYVGGEMAPVVPVPRTLLQDCAPR